MTSNDDAASDDVLAGKAGLLPFDISKAHQARIYDYLLGGKDNISQVLSGLPHSDRTQAIHRRYDDFSKTA